MPELPEVQAVVDYLNQLKLAKKHISSIESPNKYEPVFHNSSLLEFNHFLKNKIIENIQRRGKFIIFNLNSGYLLFHLRMTGQLTNELSNQSDIKYVSITINFNDHAKLFFRDTRKFGRAYICKSLDWLEKSLGIEPLSKKLTNNWLIAKLYQHNRMIKSLLLDQKMIAGLGNIYIDEILWYAKIHPKSISSKISRKKIDTLSKGIKSILKNAINYKGTTFIDFKYGKNEKGNFANELKVFNKENEPCARCNKPLTKIFVSQRGTYFCKECQKI